MSNEKKTASYNSKALNHQPANSIGKVAGRNIGGKEADNVLSKNLYKLFHRPTLAQLEALKRRTEAKIDLLNQASSKAGLSHERLIATMQEKLVAMEVQNELYKAIATRDRKAQSEASLRADRLKFEVKRLKTLYGEEDELPVELENEEMPVLDNEYENGLVEEYVEKYEDDTEEPVEEPEIHRAIKISDAGVQTDPMEYIQRTIENSAGNLEVATDLLRKKDNFIKQQQFIIERTLEELRKSQAENQYMRSIFNGDNVTAARVLHFVNVRTEPLPVDEIAKKARLINEDFPLVNREIIARHLSTMDELSVRVACEKLSHMVRLQVGTTLVARAERAMSQAPSQTPGDPASGDLVNEDKTAEASVNATATKKTGNFSQEDRVTSDEAALVNGSVTKKPTRKRKH